jgi:hypothetical protein
MSLKIVGKCGNCGGLVSVPTAWLGAYPPIPRCQACGAAQKDNRPVLEMNKATPVEAKKHVAKPVSEHKPTYNCWKCGRGSWEGGGRPICCYCGAKAKIVAGKS